jgi:hypothetical protein
MVFNATSFSPQGGIDRAFYQKAVLKKFNFVLDLEAASDFPPDVDVNYSWGKPNYRYPQYIHRSGVLLAQITDDGSFLFAANRLYTTRSAATKETGKLDREEHFHRRPKGFGEPPERTSPQPSPLVRATPDVLGGGYVHLSKNILTPEYLKDELEAFCKDADKLNAFYESTSGSSGSSPTPAQALPEASIPSLRLPPSLVGRNVSPSPNVEAGRVEGQSPALNEQSPSGSGVGNF